MRLVQVFSIQQPGGTIFFLGDLRNPWVYRPKITRLSLLSVSDPSGSKPCWKAWAIRGWDVLNHTLVRQKSLQNHLVGLLQHANPRLVGGLPSSLWCWGCCISLLLAWNVQLLCSSCTRNRWEKGRGSDIQGSTILYPMAADLQRHAFRKEGVLGRT